MAHRGRFKKEKASSLSTVNVNYDMRVNIHIKVAL
jgi:hypothetical protein